MIRHIDIGNNSKDRKHEIGKMIRSKEIKYGGHSKAKIYGTLSCLSGKRMKLENRIFFASEEEAIDNDYRPCGHCMPNKYKLWKKTIIE